MPQRRARGGSFSAAGARFSIPSRSPLPSATSAGLHDYEAAAVPLLDGDRNEPLLEARAAKTSACVRRVGRTVRRAYQMQAPGIKKLSGFPVRLHGIGWAAVDVGIGPGPVAHRERRLGPSVHFELEAYPVARIREIGARAN